MTRAQLGRITDLPFKDFEFHGFTGKRRVVSYGTDWQHSIPGVDSLRYSITFRNFRQK